MCTAYGVSHEVQYNAKKSIVSICRMRDDRVSSSQNFYLSGQVLSVCARTKYLDHYITDQLDEDDMIKQCRILYAQGNMLSRKFHKCCDVVTVRLSKAYCLSLYSVPLWTHFKKGTKWKTQTADNDCL